MKRTYRLLIRLERSVYIRVGRLGRFEFPAGRYAYTGSAKRAIGARVLRHMGLSKKPRTLHWHIDYLLAAPESRVERVDLFEKAECGVNQAGGGKVVVSGFGASDCTAGCDSHLRYFGVSGGDG